MPLLMNAIVSSNEINAQQCIISGYEEPLKISQVQEIGALLKKSVIAL